MLINDGVELVVGECAKLDIGGISKKEIVEKQLHLPKVMKDVSNAALTKGKSNESLARVLKVVAVNEISTF